MIIMFVNFVSSYYFVITGAPIYYCAATLAALSTNYT